jgi:hypothetical protein
MGFAALYPSYKRASRRLNSWANHLRSIRRASLQAFRRRRMALAL